MDNKKLLKSLYSINKKAFSLSERADKYYEKDKKEKAKIYNVKKNALYSIKLHILKHIINDYSKIEVHIINSKKYYCFYIDNFSFHSPYNEHKIQEKHIENTQELNNFSKTSSNNKNNMTLKQSLRYLNKEYNINANNHLNEKYTSTGQFIGWNFIY